jgi:hypothetical protein
MNTRTFSAQARSTVGFINFRSAAPSRLPLISFESPVPSLKWTFLGENRSPPTPQEGFFLINDVNCLFRTSPMSLTIRLSQLRNGSWEPSGSQRSIRTVTCGSNFYLRVSADHSWQSRLSQGNKTHLRLQENLVTWPPVVIVPSGSFRLNVKKQKARVLLSAPHKPNGHREL